MQDAIYQIEHAQGVVKAIDQDSKQLAAALIDGTKIVITTVQKFPFVLRGLLHVAGAENQDQATDDEKRQAKEWEAAIAARRYAVIVDEAHSSQTGETARELKAIFGEGQNGGRLGEASLPPTGRDAPPGRPRAARTAVPSTNAEEEPDWEDRLNEIMQSRGRQPNLNFFAFTATPKGKSLELFGRTGSNDTPEAFHTYSMRQAIEEDFILDVLQNYTSYDTYFRLIKSVEDDPNVPKRKAARALAKFMSLHPHNIEQKTEVMVEHFRLHVKNQMGGRTKPKSTSGARSRRSSKSSIALWKNKMRATMRECNSTYSRPLTEIIQILNDRFGTNFSEEDRLFFEQIKEKAVKDDKVIRTARANPLDKFQLGIRKLIEDLMIQRMADNDKIVTRYMDDQEFQNSAFPILAKEIFESIQATAG